MNKNKKILFMVGANKVFGLEKVAQDVLKYLKMQYQIHIIISGWNDGKFREFLVKENISYSMIKLGWFYLSNLKWSLDSMIHYPIALIKYLQVYKNFSPDIIYLFSYRYLFLLFPFINVKVIYHVEEQNSNSKKHKFFLKIIDKKVSKYIACSKFIKSDLIKCSIEMNKINLIYNGVNANRPIKYNNKKSGAISIGIVGQIIPRKGHHILIRALSLLKKEGFNFILKIFGTGYDDYIKELMQIITNNNLDESIEWKGYVTDTNLIYNEIDIAVCPAILPEPFGLTAIEPSLYNIPVITSDIGAFPEIIIEAVNGFMFINEDIKDLKEKIKYFFVNKPALHNIGISGYNYISNKFNTENMINEINRLINSIDSE